MWQSLLTDGALFLFSELKEVKFHRHHRGRQRLELHWLWSSWGFLFFLPTFSVQAEADPQAPAQGSAKFDQVQGQVNEVKVILKDNINKVLERGDRLDDLIGKTGDLQASVSIC